MIRASRTHHPLAAAALASALVLAACTPDSGVTPTTTLPGAGDSYYPGLGNTGYTADHYGLSLDIDPSRGSLSGMETALPGRLRPWSTDAPPGAF